MKPKYFQPKFTENLSYERQYERIFKKIPHHT